MTGASCTITPGRTTRLSSITTDTALLRAGANDVRGRLMEGGVDATARTSMPNCPTVTHDAPSRSTGPWARIRQVWSLIGATPFDASTPEGRSKERYRRAALATVGLGFSRAASIATSLIAVRLTVRYLGIERYGLWMTISSVALMLNFADFGLGNGLLNRLAEANGKDDRTAARRYVASAFFVLLGLAVLLGVGFGLLFPLIPWHNVFNVSSSAAIAEAGPALTVFLLSFLVSLPLGVVQRIQAAYQEGFATGMWISLGSVLSLVGLLAAVRLSAGLPALVLAMSGGQVLALALNGAYMFGWSKPWLFPRWSDASWESARDILQLGLYFFILQIVVAVSFASDNIVIAQVLGAEAVAQYAVPMRLFALLGGIVGLYLAPLWPAYGEALARGDIGWLKRTLARSLALTLLVCGIPSLLLVATGKWLVHLWVGPLLEPSYSLLLGLAVWALLSNLGSAISVFLNGVNQMRIQVVLAAPLVAGTLCLKILLPMKMGLPGVAWGLAIAFFFFAALPQTYFVRKLLAELDARRAAAGALYSPDR